MAFLQRYRESDETGPRLQRGPVYVGTAKSCRIQFKRLRDRSAAITREKQENSPPLPQRARVSNRGHKYELRGPFRDCLGIYTQRTQLPQRARVSNRGHKYELRGPFRDCLGIYTQRTQNAVRGHDWAVIDQSTEMPKNLRLSQSIRKMRLTKNPPGKNRTRKLMTRAHYLRWQLLLKMVVPLRAVWRTNLTLPVVDTHQLSSQMLSLVPMSIMTINWVRVR